MFLLSDFEVGFFCIGDDSAEYCLHGGWIVTERNHVVCKLQMHDIDRRFMLDAWLTRYRSARSPIDGVIEKNREKWSPLE